MKNRKGITLIALIISIIVLLILAGVTVATLAENGLLGKAKQAKRIHESMENLEKLQLSLTDFQLMKRIANVKDPDVNPNPQLHEFREFLIYGEDGKDGDGIGDMKKTSENPEEEGSGEESPEKETTGSGGFLKEEDIIGGSDPEDKEMFVTMEPDTFIVTQKPVGDDPDMDSEDAPIIIDFTDLDNLLPTIKQFDISKTTSSITVKIKTERNAGGKIKFYIRPEDGEYGNPKSEFDDNSETLEYKFERLSTGKYYVKVEVISKSGRKIEKEVQVEIEAIKIETEEEIGKVIITDKDKWTQTKTVTLPTKEGYITKYTYTPKGETIAANKTTYSEPFTISDKGMLIVSYENEPNESNPFSIDITKIDKTQPTITSLTGANGKITVVASDADSGVVGYAVTTSTSTPTSWTTWNGASKAITVSNNTQQYIWVKDEVGLTTNKKFQIHVHTGSSSSGGGCYGTKKYHSHTNSCKTYTTHYHSSSCQTTVYGCGSSTYYSCKTSEAYHQGSCILICNGCNHARSAGGDHWYDQCPDGRYAGTCSSCWSCPATVKYTCNYSNGESYWNGSYSCGKTTSSIDSYSVNCGYSSPQLITY